MGAGTIAPGEAAAMLSALANHARIQEHDELAQRIAALEARL